MISFVLLSLPIFGVVAIGWLGVRLDPATGGMIDALTLFSFRFALPALVLRLIAGQALGSSFNPTFYGGYLVSGGLLFGLVFGVFRVLDSRSIAAAGARATTATVSNLGFLGPPLMLALFGERGVGPLAMAILAEIMILLPLGGIVMAASDRGQNIGALAIRGTVRNPIVVAIAIGAALAAANLRLPIPIDRFLGFLGASAGPTALFALGGTLAVQRIDRTTAATAGVIALTKLVVYPAFVWCVLAHVLKLGSFWLAAGVVIAALPSAGNVYALARRYGADQDLVSAAIVLSTFASTITVPIAAWLVLG